jgi:hypothetical protein
MDNKTMAKLATKPMVFCAPFFRRLAALEFSSAF